MCGESVGLGDVALDRAVGGKPGSAVGVLHLGRAVPLDGEVVVRNLLDDLGDFSAQRLREARPDLGEVGLAPENARRQRAVDRSASDTWKRRCCRAARPSRAVS